ncbi:MAG: 2-hydroxyacyl-CoA dehydratase [Clostridiales bacterium]|nr:2-hydroxyacyl-CoA dehydratase [Clostridiales bacterium]
MSGKMYIGLDVGSTTVKVVIMDESSNVLKTLYKRHFSDTKNTVCNLLEEVLNEFGDRELGIALTGSGAIGIATKLGVPFIQEVIACKNAVERYIPKTDVIIELGGEDAKIIYFGKSIEQRMNGTCAGGTGAFLDQMALLLDTDTAGLDELSRSYKRIYPIASRCGVFAKTDIQPLLNEGVAREDIAISIFQAVVNQTISGLACGRPIKGNVAFLGGPLNYLSSLRERFMDTLKLTQDETIVPDDAHLFVAKGATLHAMTKEIVDVSVLKRKIAKLRLSYDKTSNVIGPLFENKEEYGAFKKRHAVSNIDKRDIKDYTGDAFLGIDAGSTTSKLVLIDDKGSILYKSYKSNEGKPLKSIIDMLKDLYEKMPQSINIKYSGVTGYGEGLIKTALGIDFGEVETVAHYTAAKIFEPRVTSIVDIGGQDMKYISIKNGFIRNIMLNEACSSGCGSFIETFAKSLGIGIDEFKNSAIESKNPVDLGSRCTVFMNSKIKQAQKEGYLVGDISAGLSYSVVKNAIQKVMKIRDTSSLGDYIVVQGGTFYNDAVLRAFEKVTKKNVIRPDIAGLMGAYGMAVLAKQQCGQSKKSTMLTMPQLDKLEIKLSYIRCNGCENRCQLTVNQFSNGYKYISGNRCEKGEGIVEKKVKLPNLVKYKQERIFNYKPLKKEDAPYGEIGIPRVLNMYEDYPFWFTLFTNLGFRVILSDESTRKTYEKGIESMPSESVCYPAKLVHGHIMDLIQKGVTTIFYPCVTYSRKEFEDANNKYNCPIVISYSEVIKNNVPELLDIRFINPFLPFNKRQLVSRIKEEFSEYDLKTENIRKAIDKAELEYQQCRKDIHNKGQEALDYMKKNDIGGIVLAGRPYHVDREINHGIDTLITSLGLCVLTEDSVSNKSLPKRPLRVVDQWMFHSRLYAAADFVAKRDDLELVQMNSFGCGVDAVTTDQVEEILESFGKMYTLIKIDEVNNLGAVKIRLRSLIASMKKRIKDLSVGDYANSRKKFTKEMKSDYTILIPQMAPIHFEFLEPILQSAGYKVKLLKDCTAKTIEKGLKYVNNDACYPSIITTGQFIEALESGEYDKNKIALLMSQTGGGCRATNYIGFIRKALKDAGFENVPVISFSAKQLEKNSGFKLGIKLAKKLLVGMIYADLLQRMLYKNRVYEKNKGESKKIFDVWMKKAIDLTITGNRKSISRSIYEIVDDFERIEWVENIVKPKVGIVGEILIKYHPFGNNNIIDMLEQEGAEVVMPDFMGFIKFMATDSYFAHKMFNRNIVQALLSKSAIKIIDIFEKDVRNAIAHSQKGYLPTCDIWHLARNVKKVLSTGNQSGEGWFLTAEMIEYMENDIPNVVCVQPFACLPNHVVGKGVIKTMRDMYPDANIVAVDYDPGASETNQVNRLKLLMTVAKDNIS